MTKKALGRGIDALIARNEISSAKDAIQKIPIDQIIPNRYQPRKNFDEVSIAELAQSIKENGLAQPIIVTRIDNDKYEVVAGERRLRACKMLGWREIDAIVKNDLTDNRRLILALVENLQREDLNPVEKAYAYKGLIEMGMSQNEIAQRCGKSKSAISNTLRLLELEDEILDALEDGRLTEGHARALLQVPDGVERRELFKKILSENISVRGVEEIARNYYIKMGKKGSRLKKSPEVYEMERLFESKLGTKVQIKPLSEISGRIVIEYLNLDDFERIKSKILA